MNRILEQVQSGDFDPVKMFTGNKDKFLEVKTAIESISNNLTKETCIEFLLTKIIPTAFDKTVEHAVRDEAVEIGFHFLKFVNISIISTKEQESIFNAIEQKYAKTVGELRDNNYSNWDRLWIFLIRLCHEKLHVKMSLANKLLRVVEVAFRNSTSIEQRLKAYDCWVELIDNASLNKEYMCSPKQIKLLTTPMKAKFSRMPVVIMKRCDTFVYLLEKLQDKATLCLKEFLEFCFGPFDEKNDLEKMRQGKSVPEVCIKSTKVLIELIGHSYYDSECCIPSDDIHLHETIINRENFSAFAEILINSIVECCVLLKEWNQESSSNSSIIKCLWRSLLQFIHQSDEETKKKCCTQINNLLRRLLERSEYSKQCHLILGNVIELLVSDESVETLRDILFEVSMNLLCVTIDPCPFNEEQVLSFIDACFVTENGSKFAKIASSYFKNDAKCVNSSALCEVWLKCNITVTSTNISNIVWPIRHLQYFKDVEALNSKWIKLYTSECKTEAMKFLIMQEMEKLFLDNPLLSSNIVSFLLLISQAETNSSKDFVYKFMMLIELVLTLPTLSDTDIHKLSSIILCYCNPKQHFYQSDHNDEALYKLCGCMEHIVTIHQDYAILTGLSTCLQEALPKNLVKFSKGLMSFLEGLMLNEDNTVANSARKLIELLETKENEPESVPLASSRSLRIVNMANVHPKTSKLGDQVNSLKLFGKNLDAPSPLSLRGSKLASTPRPKRQSESRKKREVPVNFNDDKSSDYVRIDTEVKVDVNNLNEHQKEVLKKRREDIPALYADLTQSLSHSQEFSNNVEETGANSKEPSAAIESCTTEENTASRKRKRSSGVPKSPKKPRIVTNEEPTQTIEETSTCEETKEAEAKDSRDIEDVTKTPESETEARATADIEEDVTKASDKIETKERTCDEIVKDIVAEVEQNIVRRSLRKNRRQSKRRQRERKKQDSSVEISDKSSENLEQSGSELVVKENGEITDTTQIEQVTEQDEVKVIVEPVEPISSEEKPVESEEQPQVEERCIRKSSRTVKQRVMEQMPFEIRIRKRSRSEKVVKELNNSDSNKSEEEKDSVVVQSAESQAQEKVAGTPRKRNRTKQRVDEQSTENQEGDIDLENESMEDLLERIDRRIEENKKNQSPESEAEKAQKSKRSPKKEKNLVQKTLPEVWEQSDGNQNQILLSLNETRGEDSLASKTEDKPSPEKVNDVYEFTGDDEFEDLKTSSKKKKKRVFLNQRDYISKRRKKAKKEVKEEAEPAIPFHVTADCASPLPLSKSQTLRAVASPQESETITIVITRSPPDSEKDPKEDKTSPEAAGSELDEAKLSPRRRARRRLVMPEAHSEDVIESSQTPDVDVPKRRSSSRNRSRAKPNTPEDASKLVETSPSEAEVEQNKRMTRSCDSKNDNTAPTPTTDASVDDNTAPTPTIDASVGKSAEDKAAVPVEKEFEKVTKPRRLSLNETSSKTKREKRKSRSQSLDKDNLDAEITFLTDEIRKLGPVSGGVAEDLAETLTAPSNSQAETLTLSPVDGTKDDLPGSPVTCDTPDRTMEFLNDTLDISPINSDKDEVTTTPKFATNEVSNVRVAKLLQMVNSNVQVSKTGTRWFGSKQSPSSSRVRKMRMKKEENLDILTFSREVPSPLTVPASGILKRKFNNVEETAAPSPKRKRVNFSYPAISEKKIFIKDVEEYVEQSTNSTNEAAVEDLIDKVTDGRSQLEKVLFSASDREDMILSIRELCSSKLNVYEDSTAVKDALKCLIENLNIPEIVEVISEYLVNLDGATIDEISTAVNDCATSDQIVNKCVVPFIQNEAVLDFFLPKLVEVLQTLPDEKLRSFIGELVKVFGEDRISNIVKEELTQQQIEDYIDEFDCDKMITLIKGYVSRVDNQNKNEFLLNLMSFASSELPVNKEMISCHVNIVQNFVKRMTD